MTKQAAVMELVKKNKGVITAKEISNENISPGIISYLVKKRFFGTSISWYIYASQCN